jgi:hypothetical protein
MKKQFIILLSVVLLGSVGCGTNREVDSEVNNAVTTEVAEVATESEMEPAETETVAVETESMEVVEAEITEGVNETVADDDPSEVAVENQFPSENTTADSKQSKDENTDNRNQTEKRNETDPASEAEVQQAEEANMETGSENSQSVAYSPDNVVNLAIAKCQLGGMVTTEQNLMDNLNTGKITQEEYNAYYPLDGLENSYYSVFVNVDLNKASCIDGSPLESEEEIAQYIADMLLLETNPVFNIRCAGTTQTTNETFYEFRCYR